MTTPTGTVRIIEPFGPRPSLKSLYDLINAGTAVDAELLAQAIRDTYPSTVIKAYLAEPMDNGDVSPAQLRLIQTILRDCRIQFRGPNWESVREQAGVLATNAVDVQATDLSIMTAIINQLFDVLERLWVWNDPRTIAGASDESDESTSPAITKESALNELIAILRNPATPLAHRRLLAALVCARIETWDATPAPERTVKDFDPLWNTAVTVLD